MLCYVQLNETMKDDVYRKFSLGAFSFILLVIACTIY